MDASKPATSINLPARTDEKPAGRRGIICKMSGMVSRHPRMAAAMITVLTIIVIGMYVFYHGVFRFGPYSHSAPKKEKSRQKKRTKPDAEDSETEPVDEETEKLIESINQT